MDVETAKALKVGDIVQLTKRAWSDHEGEGDFEMGTDYSVKGTEIVPYFSCLNRMEAEDVRIEITDGKKSRKVTYLWLK